MKPFKDRFSGASEDYAAHRPGYPPALVDALAGISPGHALALDCGCGTGQLSVLLTRRFDAVVATDASATQIASAQPCQRVTYWTAHAEDSGLPDGSVDLVTVAQAAHWLDLPRFYDEVRRVAKPDAAVALISYGVLHVDGSADAVVQRFYGETIGPYWPPERRHVEDGYRDLPFPFVERTLPSLAIEVQWRLDELLGYVGTWSAVKAAREALAADPIAELEAQLRGAWGNPQAPRRVVWPLSVRAGNVSQSLSLSSAAATTTEANERARSLRRR